MVLRLSTVMTTMVIELPLLLPAQAVAVNKIFIYSGFNLIK